MLTPRSSIQASEKTPPAEYQDIVQSRGRCAVAVLRVIGLRPTRERVALADLWVADFHRRVLAHEVNQRAALGKFGVSRVPFYNAQNQFREQAPLCILRVDRSHAYFDAGTSDHNHLFSRGREADRRRLFRRNRRRGAVWPQAPRSPMPTARSDSEDQECRKLGSALCHPGRVSFNSILEQRLDHEVKR